MRELKLRTGQTVVVALEGATLRGVLESATRTMVTLVGVEEVGRGEPVVLRGSVFVPASRILYVQAVS